MNSGMVRYTEVQLYIDFTLTVPTCNPTRPYREGEGRRENLGTRPGSQRLFVRGICLQKSDTEASRPTRGKNSGLIPSRVPNYPGYFTLNSIKQSGGARL